MDSFERIGVNRQYSAYSVEHAQKMFKNSCECCIMRGRNKPCDRCPIEHAHISVCAIFNDQNTPKE